MYALFKELKVFKTIYRFYWFAISLLSIQSFKKEKEVFRQYAIEKTPKEMLLDNVIYIW